MKFFMLFFGVLLTVIKENCAKIPDFIVTCNRNDPNLNECAVKNAKLAIPGLVKGSRLLGLPSMTPLHITKIGIQAGSGLKVELTDNSVFGLENTIVDNIDMQLDKQRMIFTVTIPKAGIKGHYKMDGHILILPIEGEGAADISLDNGHFVYTMDYKLNKKNNKDHVYITNCSITFTTTRAYYHFEHLFGGDESLGNEMNSFLNENWADVTKDLGSTVSETLSSIITTIAMTIFNKVPYDELIPV